MLDLEVEEYEGIKKYIPNYYINLVDVHELAENNSFKTDLQWIFGMLKYKNNRGNLLKYIHEHGEYFSRIDDETFGAAKALLGCRYRGERE